MFLIAGLGNPGRQYANTRHNMGYMALDVLGKRHNIGYPDDGHKAMYGKGVIAGQKVILLKPLTFMNLSGESIRSAADYYKIDPASELIVLYDDIHLPAGQLRIRTKGSAGGHNGIKNIIQHLGSEEFLRIRIGVGEKPPEWDQVDYVLGHIPKEEQPLMEEAFERCADAVELMLKGETDTAMNRYNVKL